MLKPPVLCVLSGVLPVGLLLLSYIHSDLCEAVEVGTSQCLVWGPGLQGAVTLPARYFFIQAVDSEGQNITTSLGEKAFEVSVLAEKDDRVRAWVQILDRNDGSYIVRYKLYQAYEGFTIEIRYKGQHVGSSPYKLGQVYQEKCFCPNPDTQKWLKDYECRAGYSQIKKDLSIFEKIDMKKVAKEAVSRFNQKGHHSLCHYVIKDNQVYRTTYGEHVGFKMFMDAMLLSLTRKVALPDLEFFVNLGDWPLEKRKVSENPIPIFSWCGSKDTRDIVMPTYDVTESTLETMGRCDNLSHSLEMPTYKASENNIAKACRVSLDLLSVQANTGPKWENKSDIAFWRGRDSRQERLDLVLMSHKHPDAINARLTNMFFFPKKEEYGELKQHVSFFDFFKYKYQLNIDGTVAAYRFPYLLAGDSVVLKQDSNYYEHFYSELKPMQHYVPFKRDLSDLLERIQWAKDNDEKVKNMTTAAQQYVRDNLLGREIFCYHVVLFQEYAKRLKNVPEVLPGMELVEQPNDYDSECECKRKKSKDEL